MLLLCVCLLQRGHSGDGCLTLSLLFKYECSRGHLFVLSWARVRRVVIYMCLLYVSLGSRIGPSIYGLIFMGNVMLSICSSSCVLYSAGSGVKRVHVAFSGLRMRLFV